MGVFGTKQSATRYKSVQQVWVTPDEIFLPMNEEFGFTLDAAASPDNAKAKKFFTEADDGLAQDWGKEIVWVNPPYGDGGKNKLSEWVKKAALAADAGATVVMLIPARTNTKWFHQWCFKYGHVRFIEGRPKFIGCTHGLPQPLCFVIFEPGCMKAECFVCGQISCGGKQRFCPKRTLSASPDLFAKAA